MEGKELLMDWTSIRNYQDKPVDQEKLGRILEAGARAPSAKNRQPWRFIVVRKKDVIEKIQQAAYGEEHVGKAPVIIAACTTNIDYRMPNGQLSYPIDLSFSVSFMMIQARMEGLGSCIVTTYDEKEVKELLTVPFSMRVVMLLLIGYADEQPLKRERKPFNQTIAHEHW